MTLLDAWFHPNFDPTFYWYLVTHGLVEYYAACNFQLPVAANEGLTLPIEFHLNLIHPEAAPSQKILYMCPQSDHEDSDESFDLPEVDFNAILEDLGDFNADEEMQQGNDDFAVDPPQVEEAENDENAPANNELQQQEPLARAYVPLGMPSMVEGMMGIPPLFYQYARPVMSQPPPPAQPQQFQPQPEQPQPGSSQQLQPQPGSSRQFQQQQLQPQQFLSQTVQPQQFQPMQPQQFQPQPSQLSEPQPSTSGFNPFDSNSYIHVAVPGHMVRDALVMALQNMNLQASPVQQEQQQQQQQQQGAVGENQNNGPYDPPTEPLSPPNNQED